MGKQHKTEYLQEPQNALTPLFWVPYPNPNPQPVYLRYFAKSTPHLTPLFHVLWYLSTGGLNACFLPASNQNRAVAFQPHSKFIPAPLLRSELREAGILIASRNRRGEGMHTPGAEARI